MKELNTIIKSPKEKRKTFHHFIPALALNLALENGCPIKREKFEKIISKLNEIIEHGYVRWNKEYPYDYDDTIVVRNIFSLLEKPIKSKLNISFNKGGVYTYLGGLKSKLNNNVDILINLIILDYLVKNKENNNAKKRIIKFLKKNKGCFKESVESFSKYYLSEGYFIYVLSKVSKILDIDIEKLIDYKLKKTNNKTEIGFLILASSNLKKSLMEKYKKADESLLEIFQHPRLKLMFSCKYLDSVVRKCAERKINEINFDKTVAKIYAKIGRNLYNYSLASDNLIHLIKKYKLENEKIVELGSGTANLSILLLKKGYKILGVDISKDMLKIAKEKTKDYKETEYLLQNIKDLNIKPAKIMCSHNFIDFIKGGVEIWENNLKKSIKILKSISDNLQENGFLFIHKKEPKKGSKNLKLYNKRSLESNKIKNIYIYEDNEIVMRKTYEKIYIDYNKFIELMKKFGLKIIDENSSWVVLKKTISQN